MNEARYSAIFLIYPLGRLTLNVISLLTGFFLATVLATLPSQTGDWGVVAGGS
nr:Ycf20 [Pseudoerythrocladia kornmannii]